MIESKIHKLLELAPEEIPRNEHFMYRNFRDQTEWLDLSAKQKQEKRKTSLEQTIFSSKKAAIPMSDRDLYLKNLVEVYEEVLRLQEILYAESGVLEMRISALLQIEQFFIDEHVNVNRLGHVDFFVAEELRKEVEASDTRHKTEILCFFQLFATMYRSWPNRPWKDA